MGLSAIPRIVYPEFVGYWVLGKGFLSCIEFDFYSLPLTWIMFWYKIEAEAFAITCICCFPFKPVHRLPETIKHRSHSCIVYVDQVKILGKKRPGSGHYQFVDGSTTTETQHR